MPQRTHESGPVQTVLTSLPRDIRMSAAVPARTPRKMCESVCESESEASPAAIPATITNGERTDANAAANAPNVPITR